MADGVFFIWLYANAWASSISSWSFPVHLFFGTALVSGTVLHSDWYICSLHCDIFCIEPLSGYAGCSVIQILIRTGWCTPHLGQYSKTYSWTEKFMTRKEEIMFLIWSIWKGWSSSSNSFGSRFSTDSIEIDVLDIYGTSCIQLQCSPYCDIIYVIIKKSPNCWLSHVFYVVNAFEFC